MDSSGIQPAARAARGEKGKNFSFFPLAKTAGDEDSGKYIPLTPPPMADGKTGGTSRKAGRG
ncbi:MAG: hypothetical protein LBF21_01025, partial [Puniceicoccales bacterium]|nr:hypothetical protein [Puniceicoccales bacterium]